MIRRVIVRPLAVEDIANAATWYESQRSGLGVELTDEIIRVIRRAQEAPDLFRILRLRDGMRRALTERFPYRVFFTILDDTLHVHAVLHGARHDRRWRTR
jgi:plasmid stabilization system protein ParE